MRPVLLLIVFVLNINLSIADGESIIFAGDAGETTIEAMDTLARQATTNTAVFFLGDNIYPAGLPPEDHKRYVLSSKKLLLQIEPIKNITSNIFFLPGNHDWDDSKLDGYKRIKYQGDFLKKELGYVGLVPSNGCPGPLLVTKGKSYRVVALDTQWWLHQYEKPDKQHYGCSTWTEEMVLDTLKTLLEDTTELATIVLTHHPLESIGKHSKSGYCYQNFGCPAYKSMRDKLLNVLNSTKPSFCAAGHDHNLQVLEGSFGCKYFLVSGAMSYPTKVNPDSATLFAKETVGFLKLDFINKNTVRISAIEHDKISKTGKVIFERNVSF